MTLNITLALAILVGALWFPKPGSAGAAPPPPPPVPHGRPAAW